jgi:superfamily I DNA and RNA helicase
MPATDDLFGTTEDAEPLVNLHTPEGEARRDITLPVCYRNTPWALTTAHALGFGVYRTEGLIQHFDDYALWHEIGYDVLKGQLEPRRKVALKRSPDSYPPYFPELLTSDDAVELRSFDTEVEHDAWVAGQIAENLSDDELEHDDVLVVLPDAYTSKRRASRFSRALARHDIPSHLAGVGSSVDELFIPGSIAIAHIYRAKGNEAPMVYALDAQHAGRTPNAVSRRNTLFTAITRSRAWVRICGWGPDMQLITNEVEQVRSQDFVLTFTLPTQKKLAELRRIHRERSDAEMAALRRTEQSLQDLIAAFERGEIEVQDVPPRLRTRLLALLREEPHGGDDE